MRLKDNGKFNQVYGKTHLGAHLIKGQWYFSEQKLESRNPANWGDQVGIFPFASQEETSAAYQAAKQACTEWQRTTATTRSQNIATLIHLLKKNQDNLARLLSRETGKGYQASLSEIQTLLDQPPCSTQANSSGTVQLIISDGHFPLAAPLSSMFRAWHSGQSVIWQPSTQAATVAQTMAQLIQQSDLPPGVFSLLHGGISSTEALYAKLDQCPIDQVFFAGSSELGRALNNLCTSKGIAYQRQSGYRNPLLVMDNTPIKQALNTALSSTLGWGNRQDQTLNVIILHKAIAADFKQRLLKGLQLIKIGDPNLDHKLKQGPLLCPEQLEAFLAHLKWGKAEGAELISGKGRMSRESKSEPFVGDPDAGLFVWPAIWDNVKTKMKLAQSEIWGPVLCLFEVENHDQALAVAKELELTKGETAPRS
jgi:alpha-ketoglutaric semialdehyde dehydrogenase